MSSIQILTGVYAAAVTPLKTDLTPDLTMVPELLAFLAARGAHGALLLGTTGEGPSFSIAEREAIYRSAVKVKTRHPQFSLLAGTGTPSIEDTIHLNQVVFDLGFDGVVVLPPYYFRDASEDGLYTWFSRVIEGSIPEGGKLLGYHIPQVSGVALSDNLLSRLTAGFPAQFGGIKDSSGDLVHAQQTAATFPEHTLLVGHDRLLTSGLEAGAAGCITAPANLISPQLRKIYDLYKDGKDTSEAQLQVDAVRKVLETLTPFPAAVKGLLNELHGFPLWPVKPPLEMFPEEKINSAAKEINRIVE
jgi:4-hydroxy-tetrahydrodipicolinate synthase